jgi:hypothetical protein
MAHYYGGLNVQTGSVIYHRCHSPVPPPPRHPFKYTTHTQKNKINLLLAFVYVCVVLLLPSARTQIGAPPQQ